MKLTDIKILFNFDHFFKQFESGRKGIIVGELTFQVAVAIIAFTAFLNNCFCDEAKTQLATPQFFLRILSETKTR
ncbi:hypothetical protein GPALN_006572 [Globodera pallida]|nr:hypothetical protein GPALN_006572 [Globodera pallida]